VIYRYLNAQAKAWPYYAGDRAKQRQSIRDGVRMLRQMFSCRYEDGTLGAVCTRSYAGDVSLSFGQHKDGKLTIGRTTLSGLGDADFEFYKALGVPCVDCYTADYDKLFKVVVAGPLYALPGDKVDERRSSLSYHPLVEVLAGYKAAGATLFNLEGV